MLKILLTGFVLVLFVGVIRRWFFSGAWRLIVPLVCGFVFGVPLAAKVTPAGAPEIVKIVMPIFGSLIIAGVVKTGLDEILRPPRK